MKNSNWISSLWKVVVGVIVVVVIVVAVGAFGVVRLDYASIAELHQPAEPAGLQAGICASVDHSRS